MEIIFAAIVCYEVLRAMILDTIRKYKK